jgi:hypothetical protein
MFRYQLSMEISGAKTGLSLVSDNVQQRTKAVTTKLLSHKKARTFYMPGFTAPAKDATTPVERTLLHLPSSLSLAKRDRLCRPGLIDAEQEIRLASLGDALADLTRHLRTRTFLLRYKAKEATGVRTGTRLRDLVAGVSCCIDAAAAGYHRHRIAYKALTGAGDWEKTYQHLTASDVRGLSKKEVTKQEHQERYCARKITVALANVIAAGGRVSQDQVDDALGVDLEDEHDDAAGTIPPDVELERIDNHAPLVKAARLLAKKLGPGEGRRKLLWIWMGGLYIEDVADDQLTDGTCVA